MIRVTFVKKADMRFWRSFILRTRTSRRAKVACCPLRWARFCLSSLLLLGLGAAVVLLMKHKEETEANKHRLRQLVQVCALGRALACILNADFVLTLALVS